VPADLAEAERLYRAAADQGLKEAVEDVKRMDLQIPYQMNHSLPGIDSKPEEMARAPQSSGEYRSPEGRFQMKGILIQSLLPEVEAELAKPDFADNHRKSVLKMKKSAHADIGGISFVILLFVGGFVVYLVLNFQYVLAWLLLACLAATFTVGCYWLNSKST
jgi:hypothetical protein